MTVRVIKFIFLLSILLAGCAGTRRYVSFEILNPAEITYPDTINRIGYLNRAPISRNSFSPIENKMDDAALRILDTIVCNNLSKGLKDAKSESDLPYLEKLFYIDARRHDTLGKSDMLREDFKNRIFENYKLDALIVLEYYSFSLSFYYVFDGIYYEGFLLRTDILWRVYNRGDNKPFDEFTLKDSLYFPRYAEDPFAPPMSLTNILRDASYDLGYKYGLRHTPAWYQVSRVIFKGGDPELRKAAAYTDKGDWEAAVKIWSVLKENEDQKLAAKAYHNLAVYSELTDDIEAAYQYSQKAGELWNYPLILAYQKEISLRLQNKKSLLKQFRL